MKQSKQDQALEVNLGNFIIWLGNLFVKLIKILASSLLLGLKFLLGIARKSKTSKSKLAKILYLATLILAIFLLGTTIKYIYLLTSNKQVNNNMLSASFFIFLLVVGIAKKIKFKISKGILAKKIIKLNEGIKDRFESANFKDSLARLPLRTGIFTKDKYFKQHLFYSEIPLQSWVKNKSLIEEILNTRVIKISNDKKDTTMKIVETSSMPEPKYVKFSAKKLSPNPLEIYLGLDIYNRPQYINLKETPHLLFSGGSGVGKSTSAYSFFTQFKRHPNNKIILCDFKKTTFKSLVKFNNNKPCITSKDKFKDMLKWAVSEDKRRVELFNKFDDCENVSEYNKLVDTENEKLNNILIFVDEPAVIMTDNKDKEIENFLQHIAQCGRSQHIFLIIFTQRPSTKTIPAEVRATLLGRISGYQPDPRTSEMAVGDTSANEISPIKGRVIFKDGKESFEVQMAHFQKEDLNKYLKIVI